MQSLCRAIAVVVIEPACAENIGYFLWVRLLPHMWQKSCSPGIAQCGKWTQERVSLRLDALSRHKFNAMDVSGTAVQGECERKRRKVVLAMLLCDCTDSFRWAASPRTFNWVSAGERGPDVHVILPEGLRNNILDEAGSAPGPVR